MTVQTSYQRFLGGSPAWDKSSPSECHVLRPHSTLRQSRRFF
jgi:hypothetical protein